MQTAVTLARTNRVGYSASQSTSIIPITIVLAPRHVAPHVAACELCAVSDVVPCELHAVLDGAAFRLSELLLLLVLPSAPWWARPTPMLQLLIPEARMSFDARLCHFHSSPPPWLQ
jgi:hypothetical protein